MSDEVASSQIIDGRIPPEQRKYIRMLLGEGISPRYIAEKFIEVFPEYLKSAEDKGFAKDQLLEVVVQRIYNYKKRPNADSEGLDEDTERRVIRLLNPDTLPDVIRHHFDPDVLEKARKIVVSTIHNFQQSADYDEQLKRAKSMLSLLTGLDNISYKRVNLKQKLDKEIFVKMVLLQADKDSKEDTGKVLPKSSTVSNKRNLRRQKAINRDDEQE